MKEASAEKAQDTFDNRTIDEIITHDALTIFNSLPNLLLRIGCDIGKLCSEKDCPSASADFAPMSTRH